MSKKKPIEINIRSTIIVNPQSIYESEVVSSGTGAVIKFFKRFIGKKVIVIVKEDKSKKELNKEINDLTELSADLNFS